MTKVKTIIALVCCFAVLAGCEGPSKVADLKGTNMLKIHAIYGFYMQNNGYMGPKSEDELKAFIMTPTGKFALKKMEMDPEKIDDYFIGDRDNEPLVIRYGLKGLADHAIVFEATGVEGKRLVALTVPIECDDDEYDDYLTGKVQGEAAVDQSQGEQEE